MQLIVSFLKTLGIYLASLVAGSLAIFLVESLGHILYPLPPGVSMSDPSTLENYVITAPTLALLFPIIGHAIGSMISGMTMTLFTGRTALPNVLILALIWTGIGVYVAISMPHPEWFKVLDAVVYLPMTYLGYRLLRK